MTTNTVIIYIYIYIYIYIGVTLCVWLNEWVQRRESKSLWVCLRACVLEREKEREREREKEKERERKIKRERKKRERDLEINFLIWIGINSWFLCRKLFFHYLYRRWCCFLSDNCTDTHFPLEEAKTTLPRLVNSKRLHWAKEVK